MIVRSISLLRCGTLKKLRTRFACCLHGWSRLITADIESLFRTGCAKVVRRITTILLVVRRATRASADLEVAARLDPFFTGLLAPISFILCCIMLPLL